MRWEDRPPALMGAAFSLVVSHAACHPPTAAEAPGGAGDARRICGWDEGQGSPVGPRETSALTRGTRVAVLRPAEDAGFADLRSAIAPARDTLVRVKLVVDGQAVLPITIPQRPAIVPSTEATEATIVGHRKITRSKTGPRDRIADLQLAADRVTVFVENDKPGGREMPVRALADFLARVEPPAEVFTLGVSDETTWPQLRAALIAAACYDRRPGEEPHEVIVPPP